MSLFKFVLAAAVAAGGYHYWSKQKAERAVAAQQGESSAGGFVPLPGDSGPLAQGVHVIAAENCPEEAGQRADRLAEALAQAGLPVRRGHNVSFSSSDPAAAQRVVAVLNGELPIVFVHGRVKSNPSLDEVLAEYQSGRK